MGYADFFIDENSARGAIAYYLRYLIPTTLVVMFVGFVVPTLPDELGFYSVKVTTSAAPVHLAVVLGILSLLVLSFSRVFSEYHPQSRFVRWFVVCPGSRCFEFLAITTAICFGFFIPSLVWWDAPATLPIVLAGAGMSATALAYFFVITYRAIAWSNQKKSVYLAVFVGVVVSALFFFFKFAYVP